MWGLIFFFLLASPEADPMGGLKFIFHSLSSISEISQDSRNCFPFPPFLHSFEMEGPMSSHKQLGGDTYFFIAFLFDFGKICGVLVLCVCFFPAFSPAFRWERIQLKTNSRKRFTSENFCVCQAFSISAFFAVFFLPAFFNIFGNRIFPKMQKPCVFCLIFFKKKVNDQRCRLENLGGLGGFFLNPLQHKLVHFRIYYPTVFRNFPTISPQLP